MNDAVLKETKQAEAAFESAVMDSSYFASLDDYSAYSDMVRKMTKLSERSSEVAYEFTTDVALLHQYCILREEMFKKVWDLEHFKAQKDAIDEISDIVVARKGNQCIGGGRVTFSTPHKRQKLPMESEHFSLVNALPDFSLSEHSYAEVTRIAVLSEFSKDNVIVELTNRVILRIIAEGCKYLFFISPMSMTRTHRRVVNQLGYVLTTDKSVIIPDREEYEGIQMFLSYIDLTPYIAAGRVASVKEAPALAEA